MPARRIASTDQLYCGGQVGLMGSLPPNFKLQTEAPSRTHSFPTKLKVPVPADSFCETQSTLGRGYGRSRERGAPSPQNPNKSLSYSDFGPMVASSFVCGDCGTDSTYKVDRPRRRGGALNDTIECDERPADSTYTTDRRRRGGPLNETFSMECDERPSDSTYTTDRRRRGGPLNETFSIECDERPSNSTYTTNRRRRGGPLNETFIIECDERPSDSTYTTDRRRRGGPLNETFTMECDERPSDSSHTTDRRRKGGALDESVSIEYPQNPHCPPPFPHLHNHVGEPGNRRHHRRETSITDRLQNPTEPGSLYLNDTPPRRGNQCVSQDGEMAVNSPAVGQLPNVDIENLTPIADTEMVKPIMDGILRMVDYGFETLHERNLRIREMHFFMQRMQDAEEEVSIQLRELRRMAMENIQHFLREAINQWNTLGDMYLDTLQTANDAEEGPSPCLTGLPVSEIVNQEMYNELVRRASILSRAINRELCSDSTLLGQLVNTFENLEDDLTRCQSFLPNFTHYIRWATQRTEVLQQFLICSQGEFDRFMIEWEQTERPGENALCGPDLEAVTLQPDCFPDPSANQMARSNASTATPVRHNTPRRISPRVSPYGNDLQRTPPDLPARVQRWMHEASFNLDVPKESKKRGIRCLGSLFDDYDTLEDHALSSSSRSSPNK